MFGKKKRGEPIPLIRPPVLVPPPDAPPPPRKEDPPPSTSRSPAAAGSSPAAPLPAGRSPSEPARPAAPGIAGPVGRVPWRRINGRLLVVLLLALVASGVGVHFLHAYQVKRNAHALLEQANAADRESDPQKLLRYLGQYLVFVPGDDEAMTRYGLALDEHGRTARERQRAYFLLEQAMLREPGRDDIRRRLVTRAMSLGLYPAALGHLEVLLQRTPKVQRTPKDGELEYLAGCCELGSKRYKEAALYF